MKFHLQLSNKSTGSGRANLIFRAPTRQYVIHPAVPAVPATESSAEIPAVPARKEFLPTPNDHLWKDGDPGIINLVLQNVSSAAVEGLIDGKEYIVTLEEVPQKPPA